MTVVSFGPRTLPRAWSTLRPAERGAVDLDRSRRPAAARPSAAGRAGQRRDDREAAARPRAWCRRRSPRPGRPCRWSRRCPRTGRRSPASEDRNSSEVRYCEYGSSSAPIIPLIAPSTSDLRSTVAPRVPVGDRRIRIPERLEGVRVARRRAGRQRGLPAEREAGEEHRAAGQDRDQRDGGDQDAARGCARDGRPRRRDTTAAARPRSPGWPRRRPRAHPPKGRTARSGHPLRPAQGSRQGPPPSAPATAAGGSELIGIPGDGRWTEARGVSVHLRRQTGAGTGDPWHRKSISG